ncbi:hypothetical protein ACLB6G_20510 [Zhengella sp. ZM62]|uniref:hypothetical protein n=1 Tax=Zhengella sedimenti TaxID=3390035 RepID=UPI003976734A
MNRLIRRALLGWQAWKTRKVLDRAVPELRDARETIAAARAKHGKGARQAMSRARSAMTERLRAEVEARQ